MPFDLRNNKFPTAPFFTCESPNPTVAREGSLNYDWTQKRWYLYEGSQWLQIPCSPEVIAPAALAPSIATAAAGTILPLSPVNGQGFYLTASRQSYHYRGASHSWIGDQPYVIEGGKLATLVANGYLSKDGVAYSDTSGIIFGFDVKCVGLSLSGTFTGAGGLSVRANGVDVNGASLTGLTAGDGEDLLLSDTIPAGQVIALYATVGTSIVNPIAQARFRAVIDVS